jgi:hypothetical protein
MADAVVLEPEWYVLCGRLVLNIQKLYSYPFQILGCVPRACDPTQAQAIRAGLAHQYQGNIRLVCQARMCLKANT